MYTFDKYKKEIMERNPEYWAGYEERYKTFVRELYENNVPFDEDIQYIINDNLWDFM